MSKLKWENLNMKDKMRKQGSIDAYQGKQLDKAFNLTRKRNMTVRERASLHYIMTGERI